MKLLRKVPSIEVKRCFVLSQRFTSKKMRKKEIAYMKKKVHIAKFRKDLHEQRKVVCALSEQSLDHIIRTEYELRYKLYSELEWHVALVDIDEVRMWKCAGGLYKTWTERKTVKDSAALLCAAYAKKQTPLKRVRAYSVVQEILQNKKLMINEKYLLPIAVPTGAYKKHRAGIRSIPLFLDDGNMRSLAYAIGGEKKIMMYVGVRQK